LSAFYVTGTKWLTFATPGEWEEKGNQMYTVIGMPETTIMGLSDGVHFTILLSLC